MVDPKNQPCHLKDPGDGHQDLRNDDVSDDSFEHDTRSSFAQILRRILFLKGPPHKIALGAAIAIFIGWTPLQGLQIAIALPICLALRANPMPVIPVVWISNPLTALPIYSFNYWIGWKLVGGPPLNTFLSIIRQAFSAFRIDGFSGFFSILWNEGSSIFVTLWVGCLVVGAVLAVLTYILVYHSVRAVRRATAAVKTSVGKVRERVRRRREKRRRKKRS